MYVIHSFILLYRMVILDIFFVISSDTSTCSITTAGSVQTKDLPSMRDGLSFGLEPAWEAHQLITVLRVM